MDDEVKEIVREAIRRHDYASNQRLERHRAHMQKQVDALRAKIASLRQHISNQEAVIVALRIQIEDMQTDRQVRDLRLELDRRNRLIAELRSKP